uniref:Uncharacterized protein n=1 Tax=Arundo donax TaxID=35708 RepID=A0A0A9B574_ARUDO
MPSVFSILEISFDLSSLLICIYIGLYLAYKERITTMPYSFQ